MAAGNLNAADTIAAMWAAQKAAKEAAASPEQGKSESLQAVGASVPSSDVEVKPEAAPRGPASPPSPMLRIGGIDIPAESLSPEQQQRLTELAEQASHVGAAEQALKQWQAWQQLLQTDIDLSRKIHEHLATKQNPAAAPPADRIPEDFAELPADKQAEILAKISGRNAAEALRPEIQQLRAEMREKWEEERLADEVAEAYPETVDLADAVDRGVATPDQRALANAWTKEAEANPSLSPKQAYEIVLGRQAKQKLAQATALTQNTRRAAASIQKPGPGTDAQEIFDPRKFATAEAALHAAAEFALRRRLGA